jgi:ADP-ribose pyrophosphatase YjhB (NUDIX family)
MDVLEAFKHCPRCGRAGDLKGRCLTCPSCGLDTYFNPQPVVSVLLKNSRDEYLFSERAEEPMKGFFDFPGGFLENGEDFEQAARRELKEELDFELGEIKYLGTYVETYPSQGVDYSLVTVAYTAEIADDAVITPTDDVASVSFFTLDQVPKDKLAGPSELQMIKDLRTSKT